MKTHLRYAALSLASDQRILKRLLKGNRLPHPDLQKEFYEGKRHNAIEARSINVAMGFLRGRELSQIEMPYRPKNQGHIATKGMSRTQPDWGLVENLVEEHGPQYFENANVMRQKFAEFKAPALEVAEAMAA